MSRNILGYLLPGDHLERPKGPVNHMGIYLGNGRVLHNAPGYGEHETSFSEFAKDKEVTVYQPPQYMRDHILHNASAVLADPKQYFLLTNNCEHTVRRIGEGQSYSRQLIIWGLITTTFVVTVYLLRKALIK